MRKTKIALMALIGTGAISIQADIITNNVEAANRAGEVRAYTTDALGTPYPDAGTVLNTANFRVGEYRRNNTGESWLARPVVKFRYNQDTLGISNGGSDIVSAKLRLYVLDGNFNRLNASGDGSAVQLYYSTDVSTGNGIANSDFNAASYALLGDMGFSSTTTVGAWYEIDVTSVVKADMDADGASAATAGSVFRMQLNNDLLLTPTNALNFLEFGDDSDTGLGPQLVIETIPEPATLGMVAAFGVGILFIRRRFMM